METVKEEFSNSDDLHRVEKVALGVKTELYLLSPPEKNMIDLENANLSASVQSQLTEFLVERKAQLYWAEKITRMDEKLAAESEEPSEDNDGFTGSLQEEEVDTEAKLIDLDIDFDKEIPVSSDESGKIVYFHLENAFLSNKDGMLSFYDPDSLKRALAFETDIYSHRREGFRNQNEMLQYCELFLLNATKDNDGHTLLLDRIASPSMLKKGISDWLVTRPARLLSKVKGVLDSIIPDVVDSHCKSDARSKGIHMMWELSINHLHHGAFLEENRVDLIASALDSIATLLPFTGSEYDEKQMKSVHFLATGLLASLLHVPSTRRALLKEAKIKDLLVPAFLVSLKRIPQQHLLHGEPTMAYLKLLHCLEYLSMEKEAEHAFLVSPDYLDMLRNYAVNSKSETTKYIVTGILCQLCLHAPPDSKDSLDLFDALLASAARHGTTSLVKATVCEGFCKCVLARYKMGNGAPLKYSPKTWAALQAILTSSFHLFQQRREKEKRQLVSADSDKSKNEKVCSDSGVMTMLYTTCASVVVLCKADATSDDCISVEITGKLTQVLLSMIGMIQQGAINESEADLFEHLEVMAYTCLVGLSRLSTLNFQKAIAKAVKLIGIVSPENIARTRTSIGRDLQSKVIYAIALCGFPILFQSTETIMQIFLNETPYPSNIRRYIAAALCVSSKHGLPLSMVFEISRNYRENLIGKKDRIVLGFLHNALLILLHEHPNCPIESLDNSLVSHILVLIVDSSKCKPSLRALIQALQVLVYKVFKRFAALKYQVLQLEECENLEKIARISTQLLASKEEDTSLEALRLLLIVASNVEYGGKLCKSLSHKTMIQLVYAKATFGNTMTSLHIAGDLLLALCIINCDAVVQALCGYVLKPDGTTFEMEGEQVDEILQALHVSMALLQDSNMRVQTCGAFIYSKYRFGEALLKEFREANGIRKLQALATQSMDVQAKRFALLALVQATAYDSKTQKVTGSKKFLKVIAGLLQRSDSNSTLLELLGALLRNLIRHPGNRSAIYKMELLLNKERIIQSGRTIARSKSLPEQNAVKPDIKQKYDTWLDTVANRGSKSRRKSENNEAESRSPLEKDVQVEQAAFNQALCQPVSSLWTVQKQSKADITRRWNPKPKRLEQITPHTLKVSVQHDKFLFHDQEYYRRLLVDLAKQRELEEQAALAEKAEEEQLTEQAAKIQRVAVRNLVKESMRNDFKKADGEKEEASSEVGSEEAEVKEEETVLDAIQQLEELHKKKETEFDPEQDLMRPHLALFKHSSGGRVYQDLPVYKLPDGSEAYMYYHSAQEAIQKIDTSWQRVTVGPPPKPELGVDIQLPPQNITLAVLQAGFEFVLSADISQLGSQRCAPVPPRYSLQLRQRVHSLGVHAQTSVSWTRTGVVIDDPLPLLFLVPRDRGTRSLRRMTESLRSFRYLSSPQKSIKDTRDEEFQLSDSVFSELQNQAVLVPGETRRCFKKFSFESSWAVALDKPNFYKLVHGRGSEVGEKITQSLSSRSELVYGVFKMYSSSIGGVGNAFNLQLNGFSTFLRELGVLKNGKGMGQHETFEQTFRGKKLKLRKLDSSTTDTIFIVVNRSLPDMKKTVQALLKTSIVFSMKIDEQLHIFEFLETLVRVAEALYCQQKISRLEAGVEALMQLMENVYSKEKPIESDYFREDRMLNWAVNSILDENMPMFKALFERYITDSTEAIGYGSIPHTLIGLLDWMKMLSDFGVFNSHFTKREACFLFVSSLSNIEHPFKKWQRCVALTFDQFLESMCRLAEVIFIPDEAQMHSVGIPKDCGSAGFAASSENPKSGIVGFYHMMEHTNLWEHFPKTTASINATYLSFWAHKDREPDRSFYDIRALDYKLAQLIKLILSAEYRLLNKVAERTNWDKLARQADLDENTVFKHIIEQEEAEEEDVEKQEKNVLPEFALPKKVASRRLTLDVMVAKNVFENSQKDHGAAGLEFAALPHSMKKDLLITSHYACEIVREAASIQTCQWSELEEMLNSKKFIHDTAARIHGFRRKRYVTGPDSFDAIDEHERRSYLAIVQNAVTEFLQAKHLHSNGA